MSKAEFKHYELKLIEPTFSSPITDLIMELNHLRKKQLGGSTHPSLFFQLKEIFHLLESLGSARIEGNNTTIAEYIEKKIEPQAIEAEPIKEIHNIEQAMGFIEDHVKDFPINKLFISEIHKMVVSDLSPTKEGDHNPGVYRKINVVIQGSCHVPPDCSIVDGYMDELFKFINHKDNAKYDLLKIAIAHHRFVWIHPFANGNGRTVRLFTYAMLVQLGFNVDIGRILNPTAVFCSNRDNYYHYLSEADKGTEEGILRWCEYVLKGLKEEIEKIDKLLDYKFLQKEILLPALYYAKERQNITELETKILKKAVEKQVIQASDLKIFFADKEKSEISRQIRKLINKKMLIAEPKSTRKYIIRFDNNYLLRGIIKCLGDKGFLAIDDKM